MDNQTDVSVNESKPKSHGCLIAFLITFAVIILHIAAIPVLIEIVDHFRCPMTENPCVNPIGKLIGAKKVLSLP